MKLLIGLGNPGKEYESTRHNAGFMAMDHLANHFGCEAFRFFDKHKAELTTGQIGGEKVILVKPKTYMNLSGEAVQSIMGFYKIPMEDMVVLYDDVDIPFGALRVRPHGSAGGHNGIKSLIQHLGTSDFNRIRLGIQPKEPFPGALEDYVLGKLTHEQKDTLDKVILILPSAVELLFKEGIESAMHQFNGL
ncbi:aminoacyl-tRNA hydrolase [Candidatus Peregrinibacteria bacterium CG_4_10_14_0_2_um_filter_43_11]|nr:MAG: aminoacyl-tRNA hydrolase [Candidatus Peregrinibacteria bacterium CG_4_10_14_0_2_um_filter_43_11]